MIIYQQKSPELAYVAFHELYRRFSQNVFSFLIKKLKNEADAEDLLQKIFIKIHESKHLYNEKYKFEQWLFVIARTSVIDHFRSNKRYEKKIASISSIDHSENIESDIELINSIALDEVQKELLKMKYIDELSYKEMAGLLNKSESSLRKMVSRLVINLRQGEV
ncbi:MAG: sigma-70 family RNA polymerase sigma factor [Bacteriovorax sp.]|nr:sigma-70 family RNA polymerase sigma factor [Bacteriovorax sp.]